MRNPLKIAFVASGNKSVGTVSAFVKSQFDSLEREGLQMVMFPVVGHGWKAYFKAIRDLRQLIKKENPDIVHAHYSTCGIVASLATLGMRRPKVVVSLLGSFPHKNFKWRYVRFLINHVWAATLSKSQRTADQLGIELPVIPSGVNLKQFSIIDNPIARKDCGFKDGEKYIIWCSNPSREEKRWSLAQAAVEVLKDTSVHLIAIFNLPHDDVVKYMCAADCLLLTSISEGSPNVIKEALACNCPLVSTDVGDVSINIEGVDGCEVASNDSPDTIADCLKRVLSFNGRTNGRQQIFKKGLDTDSIATKIIVFYKKALNIN